MTHADELGIRLDDPSRVVYVREGTGPCIIDAWGATTMLDRVLAPAREIVILDPLSFPYERLTTAQRAVPMTVVLPAGERSEDLQALLADPLFRHLTPEDRVLGPAPLLAELADAGVWGPVQLGPLEDGDSALEHLHRMWRDERVTTVDAIFGRFTGYRDDLITRHVTDFGAHQRSDLAMLLSVVRPGDSVVDVGAHVGSFAVPLGRACGPDGRLVAFESNAASAELLQENLKQNGIEWATVCHAAVADRSGIAARSVMGDSGNTGAATAERVWDASSSGLRSTSLDDWWEAAGQPRVDVIKLDVEGYELLALRGARALVDAHRPVIHVEVAENQLAATGTSSPELFAFLVSRGYSFHINGVERNRGDDRFELQPFEPGQRLPKVVEDVLCTADDSRLPHGG